MRNRCAASTVVSVSKTRVHSDGGAGLPDRALRDGSASGFIGGGAKARTAMGKQSGSATAGPDPGRRLLVTTAPPRSANRQRDQERRASPQIREAA